MACPHMAQSRSVANTFLHCSAADWAEQYVKAKTTVYLDNFSGFMKLGSL